VARLGKWGRSKDGLFKGLPLFRFPLLTTRMGKMIKYIQNFWSENLKERENLEYLNGASAPLP
jgi:hypothetical protein